MDVCNKRLLNIRIPDRISRPPKSISDFKRWKGKITIYFFMYSICM